MTNSINNRLDRLIAKAKQEAQEEAEALKRDPSKPNYLTDKQKQSARFKYGDNCMICGLRSKFKMNAVDHCHVKGHIRGILCQNCNMGIGYFKENVELLKSAIRYLEANKYSADELNDEEWERIMLIQNG